VNAEPRADRPDMPGYGIVEDAEGLLPWSWARQRLERCRNYWLSTVRPDGRPHTMPLWAVWHGGQIYLSTARTSRKAANLAANPACTIAAEESHEAVIIEGTAAVEEDHDLLSPVWTAYKAKYDWDITGEGMFVVRPRVAFAFIETTEDFSRTATRWTFE
jgi:nitroimidazol reductase NimA-like FMN-containing flavoprotein (pyridoxamine 5'-phosphate oxidase superfamily)